MAGSTDVRYLVLADRAVPYLLARVRWPDVAQAISAASLDWLDDPGLFELPYDPSAVTVSFSQAATVAAGWGRRLHAEVGEPAPSYIRRMPANWSDLSPSERRTWGIEFVGRGRHSARHVRRLRRLRAKTAGSSPVTQANGNVGALAAANGHGNEAVATKALGSVTTERRDQVRVPLDGQAYIRCEESTICAGLVDLSERGMHCVLPEASPLIAPDVTLGGPYLLETELMASQICLDVVGRISWHRSVAGGTHFGVAFGELASGETEGVQRFLVAAGRKGGQR